MTSNIKTFECWYMHYMYYVFTTTHNHLYCKCSTEHCIVNGISVFLLASRDRPKVYQSNLTGTLFLRLTTLQLQIGQPEPSLQTNGTLICQCSSENTLLPVFLHHCWSREKGLTQLQKRVHQLLCHHSFIRFDTLETISSKWPMLSNKRDNGCKESVRNV